jgi:aspartyl-tRNA(Asn)/glutamyl-tRNA(Gln) amidotransferase subunit A
MKDDKFFDHPTLRDLAVELGTGRATSRALTEAALARIADPGGEGRRSFTRVYEAAALAAADAQDRLRGAGIVLSPLAGLPVSIKDLFDVAGEPTTAGSIALKEAPPAEADAPIVRRLRAAGAVIVGKTNMTEFAYSGVGINPHHGTPGNPYDRARVPGGSSSGAAVSVADGCAAVAIGTDTGGSVRIPAALCGLVGFKPTQRRVPRDGAVPLSTTLDSIGPLARSVEDCALVDAILAGEEPALPPARPAAGLRLAVPQTLLLDGLDPAVAEAFQRALAALDAAGARLVELRLAELAALPGLNREGGIAAAEAYRWHATLLERRSADYDPRVGSRILRGKSISAAHYIEVLEERAAIIERMGRALDGFDGMVCPTVPVIAPPIAAFADDADYARLNLLLLRNTTVINQLDGCAISLPIERPGEAPVGLQLSALGGADKSVLAMARGIAPALRAAAGASPRARRG